MLGDGSLDSSDVTADGGSSDTSSPWSFLGLGEGDPSTWPDLREPVFTAQPGGLLGMLGFGAGGPLPAGAWSGIYSVGSPTWPELLIPGWGGIAYLHDRFLTNVPPYGSNDGWILAVEVVGLVLTVLTIGGIYTYILGRGIHG